MPTAQEAERLARWKKHQPPAECTACGNKTFKDVTDSDKQWTGYCAKCNLQHVAGYPASVTTRKRGKGSDSGKAEG